MFDSLIVCVVVVGAILSYRYAWWRTPVSWDQPRILMYHMVTDKRAGQKFKGLRVAPGMFENQLEYLVSDGWKFYTVSELLAMETVPPKAVALTFDDGFEDNYTHAFPLLKKYGAKATLYLVNDRHDRDWSVSKKAHHNSGELAKEPKLSNEQVQKMLDSGVWELGAHTMTHANLSSLSDEEATKEISESVADLEQTFNTKVKSFAYPFGIYSGRDVDIVKKAGFSSAVTTHDGIDPHPFTKPLELKRVKVSGKDNILGFIMRMRTGKRGLKK